METLTFDTSGVVMMPESDGYGAPLIRVVFSGLTPFQQGYVRAAAADVQWPDPAEGYGPSSSVVRFSDLSPEALGRMMEDCEQRQPAEPRAYTAKSLRSLGAVFWDRRQQWLMPGFPPLDLYLSDDGKIHIRERG